MKYYILTPEESEELGYYEVAKSERVDAIVGKLVSGNFAIPVAALYGNKSINKVEFKHKNPRPVNPNEWLYPEFIPV